MVTIETAKIKRGYTGVDHLIDDDVVSGLVGQQYRSLGEARQAADRTWMRQAEPRVRMAPVAVVVRLASGERRGDV